MVRMCLLSLPALLVCSACSTFPESPRRRTYETELVERMAPVATKPPMSGWLREGGCTLWHSTSRWRDVNGDEQPSRPERVHIHTRCVRRDQPIPETSPSSRVEIGGKGQIDVRGSGNADAAAGGGKWLDEFTFDGEGPDTMYVRGATGKRTELSGVRSIDFYENVVIIRTLDGQGRMIPAGDFLGAEYRRDDEPSSSRDDTG